MNNELLIVTDTVLDLAELFALSRKLTAVDLQLPCSMSQIIQSVNLQCSINSILL